MTELRGRQVLVTGATGFIGGRLIERLVLNEGALVKAFVSSYTRCARIARFPVDLVRGDLLDGEALSRAAEDCAVIFHCAYGSRGTPDERRRVNIEGTENVLRAARHAGARVVHVSTQVVYGVRPHGDLDETCERRRSGSTYADSKLEAEDRVMRAAAEGVEAVVLQPTAVYGPYAPVWTVGVLERMRAGPVPLIAGGEGVCNAVYIDDLIDAMILAGTRREAVGEAFLISAADPVSWREFYGSYEEMLGVPATLPVRVDAGERAVSKRDPSLLLELPRLLREPVVRERIRRTAEGRFLSNLLRPLVRRAKQSSSTPELDRLRRLRSQEEPQVAPVASSDAEFFASRATVRIDKARRVLGYRPTFDLAQGMELTGEWARWAGLAPSAGERSGRARAA